MKKLSYFIILISIFFHCQSPQPEKKAFQQADWVKDAIIYELNVRQFTPEGTFEAVVPHLDRIKNLGVKVIWLMPIHPIGEVNRKGSLGSYYSVKDYKDVNPEFGSKDDFRKLVKEIHQRDMKVIIDWVPNHTAWDNPWISSHPDWYYHNPDGDFVPPIGTNWDDVVALDYANKDMRTEMKEALKYWVRDFDIDGYRCDVAGYVPMDFWCSVRSELDEIKPVFMLAEWEGRELYVAFDATYAWSLEELLVEVANQKANATHVKGYLDRHFNVYPLDYIRMNFTSNHDKNSWDGTVFERFGKASEMFAVFTYAIEGIPLIYGGQEIGLKKPLRFFEKDTIPWGDHPFNPLYARLGKLKIDNPVLHNGQWGGRLYTLDTDHPEEVVAFYRKDESGNMIFALFNFSSNEVEFKLKNTNWVSGNYNRFTSRDKITISEGDIFQLGPWKYQLYVKR